jgi:phospholipid/cholesterol/gamma-HCH transport system substrate-binding protein
MSGNTRTLELGTGLFVLLGFAALGYLTTQLPGSGVQLGGTSAGYHVTARFDNVGDLKVGAPVTMAGVRIGRVDKVGIDPAEFKAVVSLTIDKQYAQIPDDSDASIQTAGLLGAKYVGLGAGGSGTYLAEGSQIQFTQSALVLENLVNKLFASFAGKKDGDAKQ